MKLYLEIELADKQGHFRADRNEKLYKYDQNQIFVCLEKRNQLYTLVTYRAHDWATFVRQRSFCPTALFCVWSDFSNFVYRNSPKLAQIIRHIAILISGKFQENRILRSDQLLSDKLNFGFGQESLSDKSRPIVCSIFSLWFGPTKSLAKDFKFISMYFSTLTPKHPWHSCTCEIVRTRASFLLIIILFKNKNSYSER